MLQSQSTKINVGYLLGSSCSRRIRQVIDFPWIQEFPHLKLFKSCEIPFKFISSSQVFQFNLIYQQRRNVNVLLINNATILASPVSIPDNISKTSLSDNFTLELRTLSTECKHILYLCWFLRLSSFIAARNRILRTKNTQHSKHSCFWINLILILLRLVKRFNHL